MVAETSVLSHSTELYNNKNGLFTELFQTSIQTSAFPSL